MKGLILAGGLGTRLLPFTKYVNKHLLPCYDKPVIYYPLEVLVNLGIKEIAIVVSDQSAGQFINLLKNGEEFGLKGITYLYQDKPAGIADGIKLAKHFVQSDKLAVILGDNIMDVDLEYNFTTFDQYMTGAQVFLKEVENPQDFGVPVFNKELQITELIEKPADPPSNYAAIGFYLFDRKVFDYLDTIQPSQRNQLEITDLLNCYIKEKELDYRTIHGFWKDAGTVENLFLAAEYWRNKKNGSS